MKIYIQVNEENRVLQQGDTRGTGADIEIDVPENHEILLNPFIYKYENGAIIKDEAYQQQLINTMKKD